MYSQEVKLASACNKALEKLGEKKCPHCKEGLDPICRICNGTGKIKWKWEPEVGEWCICDNRVRLIIDVDYDEVWFTLDEISCLAKNRIRVCRSPSECTPLLHWERIVEILESLGYLVSWEQWMDDDTDWRFSVVIEKGGIVIGEHVAKSRQVALMEMIIDFVEEVQE